MPVRRHILNGFLSSLVACGLAAGEERSSRSSTPGRRVPLSATPQGQSAQGPVLTAQGQPSPGMMGPPEMPRGLPPSGSPMGPQLGPQFGQQYGPPAPPLRMRDCSWILIDAPPPRRVKVHDIVTVIIDEKSEVTQNSRFDRQRNIVFRAQLREFLRIGTSGNLRPAALDQPSIDTQLRSQMNSYGTAKTNEGLKYRIGATVVDVLPNGTLVLEARKTIRTDAEVWEYSLTGRCRTEDINANNTLVSENVADLNISKILHGKVRDSAERGWLTALYDLLLPF